jgi:hypothetical protein
MGDVRVVEMCAIDSDRCERLFATPRFLAVDFLAVSEFFETATRPLPVPEKNRTRAIER